MGQKVNGLIIATLALSVCMLMAGCKQGDEKPADPGKNGTAAAPVKSGANAPGGTPAAGTNPNLKPEDIENRAGSALKDSK